MFIRSPWLFVNLCEEYKNTFCLFGFLCDGDYKQILLGLYMLLIGGIKQGSTSVAGGFSYVGFALKYKPPATSRILIWHLRTPPPFFTNAISCWLNNLKLFVTLGVVGRGHV